MPSSRQGRIRELLATEVPLHYRVIHGVDPDRFDHQESVEAIAIREAIALLEEEMGDARTWDDDTWASGLAEGLYRWVQTAVRRPSWADSIALEARDRLWRDGHPVGANDPWERSIRSLLTVAGLLPGPVALANHGEARLFRAPLHVASFMLKEAQLQAAATVLRAISRSAPPVRVVEVSPTGAIRIEGSNRWIERGKYWPLGRADLRERRKQAVQFLYDSLQAAESWSSPASVDASELCDSMAQRLRSQNDLWEPA